MFVIGFAAGALSTLLLFLIARKYVIDTLVDTLYRVEYGENGWVPARQRGTIKEE